MGWTERNYSLSIGAPFFLVAAQFAHDGLQCVAISLFRTDAATGLRSFARELALALAH